MCLFYFKGDVGHIKENDCFVISDRLKELIKYKGLQVCILISICHFSNGYVGFALIFAWSFYKEACTSIYRC